MQIERNLGVYSKYDGPNHREIEAVILNITVDDIQALGLHPEEDWDHLFYGAYELTEDQVKQLVPFMQRKIDFDFQNYFYVLQCFQV